MEPTSFLAEEEHGLLRNERSLKRKSPRPQKSTGTYYNLLWASGNPQIPTLLESPVLEDQCPSILSLAKLGELKYDSQVAYQSMSATIDCFTNSSCSRRKGSAAAQEGAQDPVYFA